MSHRRIERGNMLILITAFVVVCLALLFFALGYVRLVGSSSEQKTAIEAAAIAAARDISTIVINTPDFGYVGLSDSAPIGSATAAGDQYYLPVHSINTLIGTARLDYIIASQPGLDVPEWRELAKADLEKAKTAAQTLIEKIKEAIKPGGVERDRNGQEVRPYVSAVQAYQQNLIRMTGGSSYVADSMKLELGEIVGATCTPVPNPVNSDPSLNSSNMASGCYKSYVNMPLGDVDFVFAAIGSSIKLVDLNRWVPRISGLPYDFPTVIRAEAAQTMKNATGPDQTLKSAACAQPASVYDPRPFPGALTISFPDGRPDGNQALTMPKDLYGPILSDAENDVCDYLDAAPGDYPTKPTSRIVASSTWPIASDPRIHAASACKLAVYDWLRRAGTRVNIRSVVGMHVTPFLPQGADVRWPPGREVGSIPRGIIHIYKFDTDGAIDYEVTELKPYPWWVISDQQNIVECFDAITDGATPRTIKPVDLTILPPLGVPFAEVEFTPRYDMYVRIYSRRYGDPGGIHEGEPMDNRILSHVKINDKNGFGSSTSFAEFDGRGALKRDDGGRIGIGIGAIPTLMPQEDFAFHWQIISLNGPQIDRSTRFRDGRLKYEEFDGVGPGVRPTYGTNGSVADIRFRRVVLSKYPAIDPLTGLVTGITNSLFPGVSPLEKQQGYVADK